MAGGTRCTCGQGHATFGACLRAKRLHIGYCRSATGGGDYTAQKAWDRELAAYRAARAQGVQPDGTSMRQIRKALDVSDQTGHAYGS